MQTPHREEPAWSGLSKRKVPCLYQLLHHNALKNRYKSNSFFLETAKIHLIFSFSWVSTAWCRLSLIKQNTVLVKKFPSNVFLLLYVLTCLWLIIKKKNYAECSVPAHRASINLLFFTDSNSHIIETRKKCICG